MWRVERLDLVHQGKSAFIIVNDNGQLQKRNNRVVVYFSENTANGVCDLLNNPE